MCHERRELGIVYAKTLAAERTQHLPLTDIQTALTSAVKQKEIHGLVYGRAS